MNLYYTIHERIEKVNRWKTICKKISNDNDIIIDDSYHIQNDISDFIEKIRIENGEMTLLNDKQGTYGFPFETILDGEKWFTKLMIYDLELDDSLTCNLNYDKLTPEDKLIFHKKVVLERHISVNTEPKINSILNKLIIDKINPHICMLYGTTELLESKHKDIIQMLVNRYKKEDKECLLDMAKVMMTEWADLGDLTDYIKSNFKKWSLDTWRALLFQMISMLALIQEKYPSFRHNDLSMANILVQSTIKRIEDNKTNGYYKYHINGKDYYVPDIGFRIMMTDFDYASIKELNIWNEKLDTKQTKSFGAISTENKSFDTHMMLNWLSVWILKLHNHKDTNNDTIGEIKGFIYELIDEQYRGNGNRYVKHTRLKNGKRVIQKLIPLNILENNKIFEKYRTNINFTENDILIEEYNT
jgi:hypothetical protein